MQSPGIPQRLFKRLTITFIKDAMCLAEHFLTLARHTSVKSMNESRDLQLLAKREITHARDDGFEQCHRESGLNYAV